MRKIATAENEDLGPLANLFGSSEGQILDQCLIVGNMEQTIGVLSESTELRFGTVQKVVKEFVHMVFMRPTRRIGNAQAHSFQVESHLHDLVERATAYTVL